MFLFGLSYRNPKQGIVLMTTLVALILIIGIAGLLQAASLANTKMLKRLSHAEHMRMEVDAVRELARPIVAEAMLQFDASHRLSLQGNPYVVEFDGREFQLLARPKGRLNEADSVQPDELLLEIEP